MKGDWPMPFTHNSYRAAPALAVQVIVGNALLTAPVGPRTDGVAGATATFATGALTAAPRARFGMAPKPAKLLTAGANRSSSASIDSRVLFRCLLGSEFCFD